MSFFGGIAVLRPRSSTCHSQDCAIQSKLVDGRSSGRCAWQAYCSAMRRESFSQRRQLFPGSHAIVEPVLESSWMGQSARSYKDCEVVCPNLGPVLTVHGIPGLPCEGDIAASLAEKGFYQSAALIPNATLELVPAMLEAFRIVGSGSLSSSQLADGTTNTSMRKDRILWIERHAGIPELLRLARLLQNVVDSIRVQLRTGPLRLVLGESTETMLGCYESGGYYKPHIDGHADDRKLTTILYLNKDWCRSDGGILALMDCDGELHEVYPSLGTMVTFRADKVIHEVQFVHKQRLALTVWHFGDYHS